MKMLINISWRNIWRNKKRSLIIMTAVSLGLWVGIFLMAFYNGIIEERIESATKTELSHLQFHHPRFRMDYDSKYVLPDGNKILRQINKLTEVKESAGRIIIKGMIASAAGSSGINLNGVMPAEENRLTKLGDKITRGKYFHQNKRNEILVSEKLAKKLKLELNKKAIITFQNKDGDLASAAFRIIGLYKTINGPYDDSNVFVNIFSIDSLAGIPNEMNEISILLHSNELIPETEKEMKQMFPEIEIKNWMEIAPELGLAVAVGGQIVYVYMAIILLALAFGIINTMMMAVLERAKEIGMLIALGMNKVKVFLMILLETFFLIIAGCPAGLLFSFATVSISNRTGIDLSQPLEEYSSFGISRIVYPSMNYEQLGVILLLVLVTAFVSSLFPARRALKINPAEAIKK